MDAAARRAVAREQLAGDAWMPPPARIASCCLGIVRDASLHRRDAGPRCEV